MNAYEEMHNAKSACQDKMRENDTRYYGGPVSKPIYGSLPAQKSPASEIEEQLESLKEIANTNMMLVETLTKRLGPVLSNENNEKGIDGNGLIPRKSLIASRMQDVQRTIQTTNECITNLMINLQV